MDVDYLVWLELWDCCVVCYDVGFVKWWIDDYCFVFVGYDVCFVYFGLVILEVGNVFCCCCDFVFGVIEFVVVLLDLDLYDIDGGW